MSIRKRALLAAISALGVMAITSSASATSNIRVDPTGTVFPGGTITNTTSDTSVWSLTGFGSITCEVTKFDADVSGTAVSSITGVLTDFTFRSCHDTLPVIAITGCHLHNRGVPTVHIIATSGSGGDFMMNNVLLRCAVAGNPNGCYQRFATAAATLTNTPSALSFSAASVSHSASGTTDDLGAVCGNTASFSSTLTGITNSAGARLTVTTS